MHNWPKVGTRPTIALILFFAAAAAAVADAAPPSPIERIRDTLLRAQTEFTSRELRYALADEAVRMIEERIPLEPKSAELRVLKARALQLSDPAHPETCRPGDCEKALDALLEARVLDRAGDGTESDQIAFELGIAYSRLGRFEEALSEYERALETVEVNRRPFSYDDTPSRAIVYGNAAETAMALGRLDEAIRRYRQAESTSVMNEVSWELAEWGLGIALDRDHQIEKSKDAIRRALSVDPTMVHLRDEGVFFQPAGDRYYYEGLGHELAGDLPQAYESFRAFIRDVPSSRFVARAGEHVADLEPRSHAHEDSEIALHVQVSQFGQGLRSHEIMLRDIFKHEPDVKLCYARARRVASKPIEGTLTLRVRVVPSGYVVDVQSDDSKVASTILSDCVKGTIATWRFERALASSAHELEEELMQFEFVRLPTPKRAKGPKFRR